MITPLLCLTMVLVSCWISASGKLVTFALAACSFTVVLSGFCPKIEYMTVDVGLMTTVTLYGFFGSFFRDWR